MIFFRNWTLQKLVLRDEKFFFFLNLWEPNIFCYSCRNCSVVNTKSKIILEFSPLLYNIDKDYSNFMMKYYLMRMKWTWQKQAKGIYFVPDCSVFLWTGSWESGSIRRTSPAGWQGVRDQWHWRLVRKPGTGGPGYSGMSWLDTWYM